MQFCSRDVEVNVEKNSSTTWFTMWILGGNPPPPVKQEKPLTLKHQFQQSWIFHYMAVYAFQKLVLKEGTHKIGS